MSQYVPRYQALLSQQLSELRQLIKNYDALVDEMNKQIIHRLYWLLLGAYEELRSFRRSIIDEVQEILGDLDQLREAFGLYVSTN